MCDLKTDYYFLFGGCTMVQKQKIKPEFQGLKLPPCCLKNQELINITLRDLKILMNILGASPFIVLIQNPADSALDVTTRDWDLWGQAVKAIPKIKRAECKKIAELHLFDHPGGALNKYWKAMADWYTDY